MLTTDSFVHHSAFRVHRLPFIALSAQKGQVPLACSPERQDERVVKICNRCETTTEMEAQLAELEPCWAALLLAALS